MQQDLVERIEDSGDRRAKRIRLRPKSLALIEKGLGVQRQQMGELLAQLSPEQMATVQKAFRYLIEAMHKPGPP